MAKITLISAGNVILKKGRKGVMYFPYSDGKIDETAPIYFIARSQVDFPVGWIMEVEQEDNGRTYGAFKAIKMKTDEIDKTFMDKYTMESVMNRERHKIESLRKRLKSSEKEFDKMTLGELRQYMNVHYERRSEILLYILEKLY